MPSVLSSSSSASAPDTCGAAIEVRDKPPIVAAPRKKLDCTITAMKKLKAGGQSFEAGAAEVDAAV